MVSRAFQILSDPDKKAKYDKFGGDPDNRFGGGSSASTSSPFSNFARASAAGGRPGPMFEEEISPEEMFRQFFGGGIGGGFGPFGGGIFDTGPGFVFNVGGGPGIRIHQFGGGRPRRRPATATGNGQEAPPSLTSTLSSLLPLLILFVIPLLSSLFSGATQSAGPSVSFSSVPPHTLKHTSYRLKVPYYVKPRDVEGWNAKNWRNLDEQAEHQYMYFLNAQCDNEKMRQARLFQEAQGWFFTDDVKLREAREYKKTYCQKLDELRAKH